MLRLLIPLCLLASVAAPLRADILVRKAVFSDHQLFWPALEGKGKPAAAGMSKLKPKPGKAAGKGVAPIRIGVLPIAIKDYSESIPCDSCHRLSANGMEFFLENYFKDRLAARFPAAGIDLIAPNAALVEKRLNLMAYLDSLNLPWDKWLADSGQQAVYRPRDRFTAPAARQRLDKLGGMLGAAYLLLPARVHIRVTPLASNMHTGGLEWGFDLVLWNVAAGAPEWAMQYREQDGGMDLDQSLETRLDKALGAAWDGMPAELTSLWASEPH